MIDDACVSLNKTDVFTDFSQSCFGLWIYLFILLTRPISFLSVN